MSAINPNVVAALELADAGITILPVHVSWNEAAHKLDKKPAVLGWRAKATTQRNQVEAWWRTFPRAVPGIELGRSGLVVIDLDRHEGKPDGVKAFKELLGARNLPEAPMTQTGSNGLHIYFRQPTKPFRGALPSAIEVRGAGRMVVAPGATHDRWQWRPVDGTPPLAEAFRNNTIPELPDWFCDLAGRSSPTLATPRASAAGFFSAIPPTGANQVLNRPPAEAHTTPGPPVDTSPVYRELPKPLYFQLCRLMPVGGKVTRHHQRRVRGILHSMVIEKREYRNQGINDAAFTLRCEFINAGLLTHAAAEALLLHAAILNFYVAKDGKAAALDTIRSGLGPVPTGGPGLVNEGLR